MTWPVLVRLVYLWRYVRRLQNLDTDLLLVDADVRRAILRQVRLMDLEGMMMIADPEMFTPGEFRLFNIRIATPEEMRLVAR